MKRSQALISLSRDHHQTLAVALSLRRTEDAHQAAQQFLEFWHGGGAQHFRLEEDVLLPQWGRLGHIDRDGAARLAREHLAIRIQAATVEQEPSLGLLHTLGQDLAEHVRFEERELFARLEADLSEEQLEQLAHALEVADAEAAR